MEKFTDVFKDTFKKLWIVCFILRSWKKFVTIIHTVLSQRSRCISRTIYKDTPYREEFILPFYIYVHSHNAGKCRIVDILYENEVLTHLCAIMKESKCCAEGLTKNVIMDGAKKHHKYPIEILEYTFNKYTLLKDDECTGMYR